MKVHMTGQPKVVSFITPWGYHMQRYEVRMLCGADVPALFECFKSDLRSFRKVRHYKRCRRCDSIQRAR